MAIMNVDPGERHDVAAEHPEVLDELMKVVDEHRRTLTPGQPLFDRLLPAAR